jgi:hypothetical protein
MLARQLRGLTIDEQYFDWLCRLLLIGKENRYGRLLDRLHGRPFESFVPNDDNREFEGRNLRYTFRNEMSIDFILPGFFEENASVLEVMVGLAIRCCETLADDDNNMRIDQWFWLLISNCGLIRFTDDRFSSLDVDEIVDRVVYRRYERNGVGGLFPLKRARRDLRKVELWYQMSYYLVENYYAL